MPPKTKRKRKGAVNLDRARKKMKRLRDHLVLVQPREKPRIEPQTMIDLLNTSPETTNTEDEDIDPSFELNSSIKSDTSHRLETFSEEWAN